jgi:hypothetical protein
MAKKKVAKNAAAKKVAKRAPKKKVAVAEKVTLPPPAPEPDASGNVDGVEWCWYEDKDGGRIEASAAQYSVEFDLGRPVLLADASLNGEAVVPKVEGSCVRFRSDWGGNFVVSVVYNDPERRISASKWVA